MEQHKNKNNTEILFVSTIKYFNSEHSSYQYTKTQTNSCDTEMSAVGKPPNSAPLLQEKILISSWTNQILPFWGMGACLWMAGRCHVA